MRLRHATSFGAAAAGYAEHRPDYSPAELRRALPAVRARAGSAEAIPLPDASVDAVLAGNALHWFDMAVAAPEIARVLAPGGVLAGLWNVLDDREATLGRIRAHLAAMTGEFVLPLLTGVLRMRAR